jgi:hypothetical protein
MNAFTILMESNYRKNKIIGLVQGVENFVFRNSNRIRIRPATLNFDEPQLACTHNPALNVIPQLVKFTVQAQNQAFSQYP